MTTTVMALAHVIELALPQIGELPPTQRADAYDEIVTLMGTLAAEIPKAAAILKAAQEAASSIRDAEAAQLRFRNLL